MILTAFSLLSEFPQRRVTTKSPVTCHKEVRFLIIRAACNCNIKSRGKSKSLSSIEPIPLPARIDARVSNQGISLIFLKANKRYTSLQNVAISEPQANDGTIS